MNHEDFETILPLYAAGQLAEAERDAVEAHLPVCSVCQADLALWQAVSGEIRTANRSVAVPPALGERVLQQIRRPSGLAHPFNRAWQLLRAQTLLVHREMWPAVAAVMALGVIVAVISGHLEFVYFVAPMVAAASLAMLSGQENDPAFELTAATPTSPWKILLARLSIVSAYNLLLALAATLVLLGFAPPHLLGTLVLGWLAPMAFLSALALLLSLWLGTTNAIGLTYTLWVAHYVPYQLIEQWTASSAWTGVITAYQQLWQKPPLLWALAILLLGTALWSAGHPAFRLNQGVSEGDQYRA